MSTLTKKFILLYLNSTLNTYIFEVNNGNILDADMPYDLNYSKPKYKRWIVIPVNTVGVLGAGLARQWKICVGKDSKFVKNYREKCFSKTLEPGKIAIDDVDNSLAYVYAATKKHWRDPSTVENIESVVKSIATKLNHSVEDVTLHIPAIGCGLGGLNYENDVKPIMLQHFSLLLEKLVYIYV